MADSENKSSGFLKAVGGIAGSVITAVLIYYLTRPAAPKPVIEPTALNGFVADAVSHQLVRNASVTVALGQNSAHQLTDAMGRYSVVLASTGPNANMGSVDIQAPGYVAYSNTVALRPGDNFAEIVIDAIPLASATTPAPPPAVAPQPAPADTSVSTGPVAAVPPQHVAIKRAQIILRQPPPNYVKAMTTYAGIPHK